MFEFVLTQLVGTEAERLAQVAELEAQMLPLTKTIRTYAKGSLVFELTPQ